MAAITCTNCGAVLKTKDPIPPGKKVKCPKCAQAFVVPEEEEAADAAEEETPKKKPAKASKDDVDEGDEPKKGAKKPGKAPKDSDQVDDDEEEEDEGPKKKKGKEKNKSKTGLILGIVGGVLLLCCCGCGGVSWAFQATLKGLVGMGDAIAKDMKAIDKGKDDRFVIDKKDGEKIDDSKPAFTISAVAMSKEFVDDNKKALQKYKNKIVEITGEIIVITPDRKVISLLGAPLGASDFSLICALREGQTGSPNLQIGKNVKCVGKVTSSFAGVGVHLGECTMTELDGGKKGGPADKGTKKGKKASLPPGTMNITADEFARAAELDRPSFRAKYRDQDVVVKGAVEKIEKLDAVSIAVWFTTDSKTKIRASFANQKITAKKGQTIEFRPNFDAFVVDQGELRIFATMVSQQGSNAAFENATRLARLK